MYEVVEVPVSDKSHFYKYHKTWFKWKNIETGELSIQAYTTAKAAEEMLNRKVRRDNLQRFENMQLYGAGGQLRSDNIIEPLAESQDKVGV